MTKGLHIIMRVFSFIMYFLSFLCPRNKKKWVFGTYTHNFNDNPKYLFIYINQHYPDLQVIWITKDRATYDFITKLGFKVYMKVSWKGLYHCLTAKIYFFNAYASDINFFTSGGAILVNLWHGVGLKKIEFSMAVRIQQQSDWRLRLPLMFRLPELFKSPSYLVSSTDFQSEPFAKAFRIPLKRCLNFGYPRNDFLLMPEKERLDFIRKFETEESIAFLDSLEGFERVFIYMPTWRDLKTNFLNESRIDLHILNELMKTSNSALIVKFHVNMSKDQLKALSNILVIPPSTDVYSVLPYTDVLITDYSSVLYDYMLLPGKDVVLYVFDLELYTTVRDFNYPYLDNVAGVLVKNIDELFDIIGADKSLPFLNDKNTIVKRFWGNYNGNAAKKIGGFMYKKYVGRQNDKGIRNIRIKKLE